MHHININIPVNTVDLLETQQYIFWCLNFVDTGTPSLESCGQGLKQFYTSTYKAYEMLTPRSLDILTTGHIM